jgi:hypothetical protein
MHRRVSWFFLASIALLLTGCSVKVTGFYSDMRFVGNGGNVQGTEIFIVRGDRSDYFAVLQCANGAPGKPVVVMATVSAQDVELAASTDGASHCPMTLFKGHVTASGVSGSFVGGPAITLARKSSYWQ